MAKHKKKYWTDLNELDNTEQYRKSAENEFPEEVPVDRFLSENHLSESSTGRRDFLKFLGFSVTAATVAACETPVNKIIPYVNKPEHVTPGVPTYYASSFYDGYDVASIMVKTREGRPIHLIGNKHFGSNKGAINSRINSSVLMLYDSARLQNPTVNGDEATWADVDEQVMQGLNEAASSGKEIALLTNTVISPSTKKVIEQFKKRYGGEDGSGFKHVTYDSISYSGIRKANEATFGKAIIPTYDFSKARSIVSVGANFLDDWLMATDYSAEYGKRRHPDGKWMNRHMHFEGGMTLTGTNADKRVPIKPSQQGAVVVGIYNAIASKMGRSTLPSTSKDLPEANIKKAAEMLMEHEGRSLMVCGSNDKNVQMVVNGINQMLGNYGRTIDTSKEVFIRQGDEAEVEQLVVDMNAGKIGALMIYGVNPSYSLPSSSKFNEGLKKVGTTVSFSLYADESASRCKFVCPDNHYLESWNDYEAKKGHYLMGQPVIRPLYNTRQAQQSLLNWSGKSTSYHDFIKANWMDFGGLAEGEGGLFTDFWNRSLRQGGFIKSNASTAEPLSFNGSGLSQAADRIRKNVQDGGKGFEVVLYTKTGIGDGSHANNPWLQEFPDPVSRISWDNYIAMSPIDVQEMGFKRNISQEEPASVAKIKVNGQELELPVLPMPGQKKGTVGIALGYGRGEGGEKIGKAAFRNKFDPGVDLGSDPNKKIPIGENAFPLVSLENGQYNYVLSGAEITPSNKTMALATVQIHHTIMDRESVLKETNLNTYRSEPKEAYNDSPTLPGHEDGETVQKPVEEFDLWQEHLVEGVGHHWGMSIDLSTCIGCGACVTACHSENNVPVVGKDEVRRGRDMHWLRIDRYFSSEMESLEEGEEEGLSTIETYREMEDPDADNPATTFMPVMCQHCNHAPCETVCPVAATTHSNEGLNQMTYNRCIGTRYCANNCPYKVRRFNWFNYKAYDKFEEVNPAQDVTMRMVLNPDVTVRSRGVMEKCSMCVQRIQQGKLEAKIAEEPVQDGDIQTACAEACPTHAITFGDLNDKKSQVNEAQKDKRTYFALEEVGTRPSVSYKVKVRNKAKA